MGRAKWGYGPYRGRRTLTDVLRWIAVVLAALVALVVVGLVLGQDYIVYTDSGLRLEVPFFQREREPEPDLGEVEVLVDPGASASLPEEPEEPEKTGRRLIAVSLEAVLDGSAAQQAQQAGADGVVVEMKDAQGRLGWYSQQPMAQAAGANVQPQEVNGRLEQWNQGELYTVARLNCFQDEAVGRAMSHTIITQNSYRWQDKAMGHWASPADEEVQEYLAGLAAELAQLGFDEILLEHGGYPSAQDGYLGNIREGSAYGPAVFAQVEEQFLQKVSAALEPYEAQLSALVTLEEMTGAETSTGLDGAVLSPYVSRLWMAAQEDEAALPGTLEQLGFTQAEERLVLVRQQLAASSQAQVVLDEAQAP